MVIPREPRLNRGLRRDYTPAPQISFAYLLGVLHDASVRKRTYRIATKSKAFAITLQKGIKAHRRSAWIYKEGKDRNLWIVEFSKSTLKRVSIKTTLQKIDYLRGFFDSEGGIARSPTVRFYIYYCQKDLKELQVVKKYLTDLGIECGRIHNPSKRNDPNYWRFYIRANSYKKFAKIIGSYHPEKRKILRMKI